jgi:drug/metabolite transporter (DMT)-like permease
MLGFALVLLGSLSLAVQNVLLRIVFVERPVLGIFSYGGLIAATTANSLVLLQLRSLFMLLLMLPLAPRLHPTTWTDLRSVLQPEKRHVLLKMLVSSGFLFLALASLFIALANISAGVATTLFLIHPVVTMILSWRFFGDRPTWLRLAVLLTVLIGSYLVLPNFVTTSEGNILLGAAAAISAGITYSSQGVLAQTCFQEIHPVPFTLASFIFTFILSAFSLLFINVDIRSDVWLALWLIGFVSAALTMAGHILYNFGIHLVSAALMSIVAVSNPAFTALFAWIFIAETLQVKQMFGIAIVILGVVALSQEKKLQETADE